MQRVSAQIKPYGRTYYEPLAFASSVMVPHRGEAQLDDPGSCMPGGQMQPRYVQPPAMSTPSPFRWLNTAPP